MEVRQRICKASPTQGPHPAAGFTLPMWKKWRGDRWPGGPFAGFLTEIKLQYQL